MFQVADSEIGIKLGSMSSKELKVALVGRPNVGKSTLFNRLTRSKKALVDPSPGLTRDVRQASVEIDGGTILLFDTGGLAAPKDADPIAELVYKQGLKFIEEAHRILLLVDAKQGITAADRQVADLLRERRLPFVVVANKVDNAEIELGIYEFYELGTDELIPISAEHGRGINKLKCILSGWAREAPKVQPEDQAPEATGEREDLIRLALIGRPNAGKSSLLNRLAGEERMIVTDIPGTTRDAIDTMIRRPDGTGVLITDTAGIRRRSKVRNRIEKFSVLKAIEAIRTSHIALVLLSAEEGITDQDKRLIGYTDEYARGCITLYNKWDLIRGDHALIRLRMQELKRAKRFVPYAPHLNISALTSRGLDRIFPMVDEVYRQFHTSTNTGTVNQILRQALAKRTPPIHKGHHVRLYYATQIRTGPPTFLIFANYPDYIPNQYKRFLVNQFREQLDIPHTPVRLVFRQRKRRK